MIDLGPRTAADATLFVVSYLAVKDIFSTDNSSPQTTELNAAKRAPTLMKWVNIAAIESIGLLALAIAAAPDGSKQWPLLGGTAGLLVTYAMYLHAKQSGLNTPGGATESYT